MKMKHRFCLSFSHCLNIIVLALALTACGTDSHHFKIEGRLLHLNQGEFYVYSPNGDLEGIDTIKVQGGRFALEIPLEEPTLLMMVFPNFTQQPIFAEPGATVDIKGDASHLKEMTVKGTDANELMNKFRESIVSASPPEMQQLAVQFIKDHPESVVSAYLVAFYVMQGTRPDYRQATSLINLMLKEQPRNGYLIRLKEKATAMQAAGTGGRVPRFTAQDINGKPVGSAYLASAPVAIVTMWASWNYESVNMQRQLRNLQRDYGDRLRLMSICIDGSKAECRNTIQSNLTDWPVICDGQMLESKLIRLFGLWDVPDNILYENGRETGRGLSMTELEQRLKKQADA